MLDFFRICFTGFQNVKPISKCMCARGCSELIIDVPGTNSLTVNHY